MSKFQEMCKAFADARNNWTEYYLRCCDQMNAVIRGFETYCELPSGVLFFLPQTGETPEAKTPLPNAMYFDPSDGYWRLKVCITLFEAPNAYPHHPVYFTLCLKEADGKVVVKRPWDDKPRQIDLNNKSQCDDFYDGIVERVKDRFAHKPQDLAKDESRERRQIGFSVD